MKHLPYLVITIFLASCNTQRPTPLNHHFDFVRPSIDQVDPIEMKNEGIRIFKTYTINVSKDYFPNAGTFHLGQPLLYLRDTATLKTEVTYFFSQPDSSIRLIEYSWNASKRKQNEIERLFDYNKKLITQSLQQPGKETVDNQDNWSRKTIIWENDSVYVKQFMLIQDVPSRTRVLISWKGDRKSSGPLPNNGG